MFLSRIYFTFYVFVGGLELGLQFGIPSFKDLFQLSTTTILACSFTFDNYVSRKRIFGVHFWLLHHLLS